MSEINYFKISLTVGQRQGNSDVAFLPLIRGRQREGAQHLGVPLIGHQVNNTCQKEKGPPIVVDQDIICYS